MLISIAVAAILGFGLGLWLRMFSLLGLTFIVALGTWALGFSFVEIVLLAAAFQLSALAAMALRHRNASNAASKSFQLPSDTSVSHERPAVSP